MKRLVEFPLDHGGSVLVEAIVDTTGHVDSASVRILSSSHPGFEAPAREAVIGATFAPGRIHGRAVLVRVHIPLNFSVAPSESLPPGVYSERAVTERPQPLNRPPLTYPDSLRVAGVNFGAVVVTAIVDSTGHVDSASVRIRYSSNPGFEAPARAAVIASSYAPGRINGRAVPVMVVIEIRCRFEGKGVCQFVS